MPHVKIVGVPNLTELCAILPLINERDDSGGRKIEAYYLERGGEQILAECLVIDVGRPRHFFLCVRKRKGETIVRLLPATDPEKTEGVMRLVARLGLAILAACPAARLLDSNLSEQIEILGGSG